jgi:hypothetical protein
MGGINMQWTLLGFIVSLAILCLMESLSAKKEVKK